MLSPDVLQQRDNLVKIHVSEQFSKTSDDTTSGDRPSLVTINVSRNRFQTYLSTLDIYPTTLLNYAKKRQQYWNEENREHSVKFSKLEIPTMIWREYIWFYLGLPLHSRIAHVETLPAYNDRLESICEAQRNQSDDDMAAIHCPALFRSSFFIIQSICVANFTVKFVLRLIHTQSYVRFVFTFFNYLDLAAILPYFILLGIELSSCETFLFDSAAYFVEQDTNGDVSDSIPKSVYWEIVTFTGVGYG
ncbi:unnamed protein product [Adineta ricciae]|uniref:Uncharacterized protein n=1 Tax=Adineta ricciae TaxID=249248 RepID=A0A814ITF1_ADIRI|nr:unnamed protein product [Adineta ricciae]